MNRVLSLLALTACVGPAGIPTDRDIPDTDPPADALAEAESRARARDLPTPDAYAQVPSGMGHFAAPRQASTWRAGPVSDDIDVQIVRFEEAFGEPVGTSPWHLVSTRRYAQEEAVTVWGASLTDAYRVVLDGDRFEVLDRFAINALPLSIPWNLMGDDAGRITVPDPNGWREGDANHPCRTAEPSLLRLSDGDRLAGPITCERALELTPARLRDACDIRGGVLQRGTSGVGLTPTFTGELATRVNFEIEGEVRTWMVIVDDDLAGIVGCAELTDSPPTNEVATEPEGDGITAFYAATGRSVVKMAWDSRSRSLERRWERELPIRGRTGTTPTLVDTPSGERLVVLVDAPCAVASVLNGLVTCDADTRPASLVAVRRDDDLGDRAATVQTPLPAWLHTVENSPAARGDHVVVANYSGYLPNGLRVPPGGRTPEGGPGQWLTSPDAVAEHATGLVALAWSDSEEAFVIVWEDAETQYSGVPTISDGANRVYGTGAESETGRTYVYAHRLRDDEDGPAGERLMRVDIGEAPFRDVLTDRGGDRIFAREDYALGPNEAYDAGNNLLITQDRSLLVAIGDGLARLRDR